LPLFHNGNVHRELFQKLDKTDILSNFIDVPKKANSCRVSAAAPSDNGPKLLLRVGPNSGGDCLPKSLMTLDKRVIRKIIAEDGANAMPE